MVQCIMFVFRDSDKYRALHVYTSSLQGVSGKNDIHLKQKERYTATATLWWNFDIL